MSQTEVATVDDSTVSMNAMRTGWDENQPQLTPDQVGAADFGQIFAVAVDGQVYAQPVVAGDTVVVATENNKVYGIHAATGAVVWSRSLGAPWPASAIGCGDLVPNIGVTSTPVYDAASGLVYLTAKVNDGPDASHPHWYMHALEVKSGADHPGWPVTVQGSPANNPANPFDPFTAMQRTGLLLLDGEVFAGFGSHCDHRPYVGYVIGVKTGTRALRMWATEGAASGVEAGVWMSGGGLVSDGPGRIFFATGNGTSPAPGPGNRPPGHLAESVVRLSADSGAALTAQDFFSPGNADNLDANDQDLGSGGPVALPSAPFGTAAHPHLMVQVGKDGRVFLLDRDDLGGRKQGPGGADRALAIAGPFRGVWGHPAVWGGDGGFVYVAESDGFLRALRFGISGSGTPVLASAGTSSGTVGHYPGSPVVTSSGTTSGTALVWVTCPTGPNGAGAQLRAYDAVPVGGVLPLRWSAPIGTAVKFPVAAVSNGRVYVGTRDGHLLAFGHPAQAPLTGRPVDFGAVAVGSSQSAKATMTATRAVTITAITTTAPFAVPSPPALPVTLNARGTFDVPVRFSPAAAGGATAALSFAVTVGGVSSSIGLDLHGTGTKPGFGASPSSLSFGELATGAGETLSVAITNTGTAPETVAATTAPAAPFTAAGLPAQGAQLAPGASISVSVTYAPTVPSPAGGDTGQLTVSGTNGLSVTVPLTGTAITGAPQLTISPTGLGFGPVPVGGSARKTFDISNSGNLVLTITKAAPPTAPFATPDPIAEGQQLNPGAVIHEQVVFLPTAAGAASGHYLITGNDGKGVQTVSFTGTGTPAHGAVPAPGAEWALNGTAALSGGDLVLTRAVNDQAGSAFYGTAVPSAALRARFTAVIGGGTGADGLAFVLLDPAHATPKAVGHAGGGLGYAGLSGVAITLDTFRNGNVASSNFVGVARGGTGDVLAFAATATDIGHLRTGSHVIDVTVAAGHIHVSVDGKPVIDTAVSLPGSVLVGFTAATGGLNDNHTVRAAAISY